MEELPLVFSESITRFNTRKKDEIDPQIAYFAKFVEMNSATKEVRNHHAHLNGFQQPKIVRFPDIDRWFYGMDRWVSKSKKTIIIVFPDSKELHTYLEHLSRNEPRTKFFKKDSPFRIIFGPESPRTYKVVLAGHGYGGDIATLLGLHFEDFVNQAHAFNPTRDGGGVWGCTNEYFIRGDPEVKYVCSGDQVYEKRIGLANAHSINQFC